MSKLNELLSSIKAKIKYCESFLFKEWDISNYPVRFKKYTEDKENKLPDRYKPVLWSAQIVNWWQMSGYGDTKKQAYADLVKNFETRKKEGGEFPRPGTGLPLEFASTESIDQYSDIATDFFRKIFDMDYNQMFISDQSSLWHFHVKDSNDPIFKKISDTYNIDLETVKNGNLVKIFEKIKHNKS